MKNKYTDIVLKINKTVRCLRHQDYYFGNVNLSQLINDIMNTCDDCIDVIEPILELIFAAQQNEDYVLVADYLEAGLLPCINELNIKSFKEITDDAEKGVFDINVAALEKRWGKYTDITEKMDKSGVEVKLEWSAIGTPTMSGMCGGKKFYFHSNNNPVAEANEFAEYYCSEDVYEYAVIGLGLAYIPQAILEMDERYKVTVIETNRKVLHTAMNNVDMSSMFVNDRFDIIICNEENIINEIEKLGNKRLLIHYPSIRMIKDVRLKEQLNDYFIKVNSIFSQKKYLDSNYFYNQKNNSPSVAEVMLHMRNKRVMYIGGGPSLEENIDYVKSFSEEGNIVVCASTVYRGLLAHDIIPTYVMIIDAKESMSKHFEGIDYTGSKLIYMCTASRRAVSVFKGDKYICYQNGFYEAEKYAEENNIPLIETGGSVSTAAVDVILRSGCSELVTVGIDFAHTNGKSHSFSAPQKNFNGIKVESVDGGEVETTKVLNIYRKWIENRIKGEKIKMINISRGAYINGMENIVSAK